MRRLPERARGPLMDRPPVSTYAQALAWLMRGYDIGENPLLDDEPLPDAAFLVCDLFWVTERQLRLDLRKAITQYNEITAPGPSARRRFSRGGPQWSL